LAVAAFAAHKINKFSPAHPGYITAGPGGSGKCTVAVALYTTVSNRNGAAVAISSGKVVRTNTIHANQACGQTLYTLSGE
jgi:adenylylsulfate kinase-like enzyme